MSTSPYAAAPSDKLDEIIREAEHRLQAQLTVGVAADQRAMTFAGFLAAVDAALIAALVALKDGNALAPALVVMIIGFGVAAGFAVWAAQPVAWELPGNQPRQWLEDIAEGDTLHNGRAAMAEFYDDMIGCNDRALASNANHVRVALVVVMLTLVASAMVAFVWR